MIPKWLVAIRARVPRGVSLVLGLVPILVLLALWWSLTRGEPEFRSISRTILPSPEEVVGGIPRLVLPNPDPGELREAKDPAELERLWSVPRRVRQGIIGDMAVSLRRIGLGYALALAVALPLGILMGSFGVCRALFAPTTTASGYIPIATLVPLTMSWFGIGEQQKVLFLAMAFGIFLLPMVVEAIGSVADVYLRTAETLGASRLDIVYRVLIPIAMPNIWQGMRVAFGIGWTYLVLTEAINQDRGLGRVITVAQSRGHHEHIYVVIMLITVIAWIADIGWVQLGQLLFPYRRGR